MSNVAHIAERAMALADTKPAASTETKQLFMMLHGMYGNLFVSKFATGELNDNGKDKGILSAMKVWEAALKKYFRDDNSIIAAAVEACKTKHVEYPPSLPQFVVLCEAELSSMPRPTFFEQGGTGRVLVGVGVGVGIAVAFAFRLSTCSRCRCVAGALQCVSKSRCSSFMGTSQAGTI